MIKFKYDYHYITTPTLLKHDNELIIGHFNYDTESPCENSYGLTI